MQEAIKRMHENYNNKKIILPIIAGNIFQSWKNIDHFISNGNYSEMITVTGDSMTITKPLKWLEDTLKDLCFYRVHKSYLVNIYHINQIHRSGEGTILMESNHTIPISRTVKKDLCLLIDCT